MIKNQGIFDRLKNTFDRSKFLKFEFFEKIAEDYAETTQPK